MAEEFVVNYGVLETGKNSYNDKAGQLEDLLKQLTTTNTNLMSGWKNQSAEAFVGRFNSDHKVAIEKVIVALKEVADFIQKYSDMIRSGDVEGANALRLYK